MTNPAGAETQTPRTDAVANRWCNDELVTDILREWADFARTLERELTALKSTLTAASERAASLEVRVGELEEKWQFYMRRSEAWQAHAHAMKLEADALPAAKLAELRGEGRK